MAEQTDSEKSPETTGVMAEAKKTITSDLIDPSTENMVEVEMVAGQPVWDHCVKYAVGDKFTTTAVRAAELGERVKVLGVVKK